MSRRPTNNLGISNRTGTLRGVYSQKLKGSEKVKAVVYVRENANPDKYTQFNECARYASRYGLSIEYKVFDSRGDRLQEAINKAVFTDDIHHFIVYSRKAMSDSMEDVLFHQIYMTHFGVNVHFVE